jgi:(p)ppGpp synthase/HD superfamily hydrolase
MGVLMRDPIFLSERFDRALLYATHVHGGQVRKGTTTPYIAHLLAVAATVLEHGGTEDLAIAALLHDAVEDQGGPGRLADIRNRFGDRVADIVHACSDSTTSNQEKDPWQQRKIRYIEHLDRLDADSLLVSLSDKVHNARSILRDFRTPGIGNCVFERFKGAKVGTLWYYEKLAEKFVERLEGAQLARELQEIIEVLKRESGGK